MLLKIEAIGHLGLDLVYSKVVNNNSTAGLKINVEIPTNNEHDMHNQDNINCCTPDYQTAEHQGFVKILMTQVNNSCVQIAVLLVFYYIGNSKGMNGESTSN